MTNTCLWRQKKSGGKKTQKTSANERDGYFSKYAVPGEKKVQYFLSISAVILLHFTPSRGELVHLWKEGYFLWMAPS